ncbi:DUF2125 domain-containing protein [Paracoccus pacificus]|uniref:DUF2125 domain-containing protein n=1 Tax=Paracoccus pacificus TaxID=1463598 RepID=A0ABW4RBN7_9RHOB
MRKLLIVLVAIAVVLGLAWAGTEWLMANRLRNLAETDPGFEVQQVRMLRDPARIGVQMTAPRLGDTEAEGWAASSAMLWLSPKALNQLSFSPSDDQTLTLAGRQVPVQMQAAAGSVRFSPTLSMAISNLTAGTGPVSVDGAPLMQAMRLDAELVPGGYDAPKGAGATYRSRLTLTGLDPVVLTGQPLPVPGNLTFEGQADVWLDHAPARDLFSEGLRPPRLIGLDLEQSQLSLGDLSARVMGRVTGDDTGRPSGVVMIYTKDADRLVQAAADAGLIRQNMVPLAMTAVRTLAASGSEPVEKPPADPDANPALADIPTGLQQPKRDTTPTFPAAAEGELRLPLHFQDGQIRLGPLPLGPAPVLFR